MWNSNLPGKFQIMPKWRTDIEECLAEHREAIEQLSRGRDAEGAGYEEPEGVETSLRSTIAAYRTQNIRYYTRIEELEAEMRDQKAILECENRAVCNALVAANADNEALRELESVVRAGGLGRNAAALWKSRGEQAQELARQRNYRAIADWFANRDKEA